MDEPEYVVFSLTKMTGQESKQLRTAIFFGVETPLRALTVCLVGGMAGVLLGAALWPMLGAQVILVPVVTAAIAWWLFERRSSRGLQLRTYRAVRDTMSKDLMRESSGRLMGSFILCGEVISMDNEAPGVLSKSSQPVVQPDNGTVKEAVADPNWWTA